MQHNKSTQASFWALIVAAGSGQRMGAAIPKQYLELSGRPILSHTIQRALSWSGVTDVVVVTRADDQRFHQLKEAADSRVHRVDGGSTRSDSVKYGLDYIQQQSQRSNDKNINATETAWVLVHDAARPLVRRSDVEKLCARVIASGADGGLLAIPSIDTLKKANADGQVEKTVLRHTIWQAQTPQLFDTLALAAAIEKASNSDIDITDEASAMEAANASVLLVEGSNDNMKVTRGVDLEVADFLLQRQLAENDTD